MHELPQNIVHYQEVSLDGGSQRLDNYLIKTLKGVPKSHIYRIIRSGEVRVNKKRAKPSDLIVSGDMLRIPPIRTTLDKQTDVSDSFANKLKESIIYEDTQLIVINKPSGMAVHGGSGISLGVIEALRKLKPELDYLELAHRLDKETSGCLIIAKKRSFLRKLQELLVEREVNKTYWAILTNPWQDKKQVVVDMALEKNVLASGERMVRINESGKPSKTTFKLLENYTQACMVEVSPKTGRTHQIRVHSAYLGHPILGDKKYGATKEISGLKQRLYLHARAIAFRLNEKDYSFQAELDEVFTQTRSILRDEKAL